MFAGLSLHLVVLAVCFNLGCCRCYFPAEVQGTWETQAGVGVSGDVRYRDIVVDATTISGWGSCHARIDQNIVLNDRSVSSDCYRCVRLEVVSTQVVQVWSLSQLHTCYTSDQAAFNNCPTLQAIKQDRAVHMMLYKSVSALGETEIQMMECPLNGRFTFTYQREGGGPGGSAPATCSQPTSQLSNCPHGFGYEVIYRDCSFDSPQSSGLQCLGSWTGHDGRHYLAVWDTSHTRTRTRDQNQQQTPRPGPKYKCGMFREEAGNGRVYVAFSKDSTCSSGLVSPTNGYEMYVLNSMQPAPLPPEVTRSPCTFPTTLLGHWHHTLLATDTMVFKDYRNYKTYSASCMRDMGDGERFIVYTRSHCGEWNYNCLWLKRRTPNILEFMMGLSPREVLDDNLCSFDNFGDHTSWITQAKSVLETAPSCPVVGGYSGVLPDASGICAHLRSDCTDPQLMYFQVTECRNQSDIYEEREYQCLGQWEEEGRVYALTYRRDIKTYECFVGVLRDNGELVFIKEAGGVCSRGVQPEILGMKLHRTDICPLETTSATHSSQTSNQRHQSSTVTPRLWQPTTKPWKPITGRPSERGSGGERVSHPGSLLWLLLITTIAAATLNSIHL